jgi:hypothetical protein
MRYSNLRLIAAIVGVVVVAHPHLAMAGSLSDLISVLSRGTNVPH